MKIYTKTGDEGNTSLYSKNRVPKDHMRVETYGTVDEANAVLGLAKSLTDQEWVALIIDKIQKELVYLNADLATDQLAAGRRYFITEAHVVRLESEIDKLEAKRIPQKYFVTPGKCEVSAAIDLARTVVRRAERSLVKLKRTETVPKPVALYLNRLSDLLFVLARCAEQEQIVAAVSGKVTAILNHPEQKTVTSERSMLAKAKLVVAAAEKKAAEIGIPMVIAVVDQGGNLVIQERMDGSLLASISLAFGKAYTAVSLKMPTDEVAKLVIPGNSLYGLNANGQGNFVVFGGGFPLREGNMIVGAVGVSGGTVDEDMSVARAGLSGWPA